MSLPTRLSGILAVAGPTLISSVTTLRASTFSPFSGVCLITVSTVSSSLPETFSNRGTRLAFPKLGVRFGLGAADNVGNEDDLPAQAEEPVQPERTEAE